MDMLGYDYGFSVHHRTFQKDADAIIDAFQSETGSDSGTEIFFDGSESYRFE